MAARDPLDRGTLRYRQHGVEVELHVLEGTFSAAGVDAGTRHLLRWLAADRYRDVATVLDVGCGYGPLALWLAAAVPQRRVTAVDRDARAVAATVLGAGANGVADRVTVGGGLGYDDLGEQRFDLIVSNIPAKVGPQALRHLLLDAVHHITPAGTVAVVVVDRLAGAVGEVLGDPAVDLLDTRPTRSYTAFEYRFTGIPASSSPRSAFDRGAYRRAHASFGAAGVRWEADVSWSIAEFDGLSHGTQAAARLLVAHPVPSEVAVAVAGVGQGHLALALAAAGHRGPIHLVDRDLLALRTARANLGASAGPVLHHHSAGLDAATASHCALAVVQLPPRQPVSVTAALLGPALAGAGDGPVVLHGRSADVARVLELLPRHGPAIDVLDRVRIEGHVAVRGRPRRGRT